MVRFDRIEIVGACAISCLEAWILAFNGTTKTENLRKSAAQKQLGANKNTDAMVTAVDASDFSQIPRDAETANLA